MQSFLRSLITLTLLFSIFLSSTPAHAFGSVDLASFFSLFTRLTQLLNLSQPAQVSGSLSNGLIAHYTFDEGSGITADDSSGNNYDASLIGEPARIAGNVGSGALSFDGANDYVVTPSLPFTGSGYSLSFWVKGGTRSVIGWGLYRSCSVTGTQQILCTSDGDTSGGAGSASTLADNNWHHISYVANGNSQTLYFDGVAQGSGSETINTSSSYGFIGVRMSSSNFYTGSMDDVRFYTRALTSSEVADLYSLGGGSVVEEPQTPPVSEPPATGTDTTAPTISSIQVLGISQTGATINWTTNESADTQVEYGLTTAYGSATSLNENLRTSHSQTLSGLQANTVYNYRVKSKDASGNLAVSSNRTFTTTATGAVTGCGTEWYVDKDATGSANGCSWANAWPTFASIDWTKVKPGNIVWISGGLYPEYVEFSTSGTESNPILIKVSQEAGHNDLVTVGGFSMNNANWITIDGAKNDNYASNIKGTVDVPLIKNNINLKVDGKILDSHGFNMGTGELDGFKVKWVEVTTSDNHPRFGFRFNPSTGYDNIEIAYTWIHDVGDDGINSTQNNKSHYDVLTVHHSIIERVGDDGMEVPAGNTVHHNIIHDTRWLRGHPDGMQTTGNYQRIYNNIFSNWANSNLRVQGYEEYYTAIQIYNNLFFGDTIQSFNPVELVWYGNQQPWNTREHSYWKDWIIVGNTFANFTQPNAFTMAKRSWLQNAHIENMRVLNNLFVNISNFGGTAFSIPGGDVSVQPSTYCCWYNSEENAIFDYNVVARTTPAYTIDFGYNGKLYTAEKMTSETRYKNNSSAVPSFVNLAGLDFRLTAQDTAARDKGANLSYLNLPSINEDLAGNVRGQNGAWDIGAFEYPAGGPTAPVISEPSEPEIPVSPAAGLVAHIDFNGETVASGEFADKSGNNNEADCQRLNLDGTINDQCPSVVNGPDNSNALQFLGSTCDMASDYLAIPRSGTLTSLNKGTVSFWGAYNNQTYLNQKFLDTFTINTPNTWLIGRDGDKYPTFTISDNSGAASDLFTFPGANVQNGSWNHYALSWDGNTIKGYFNGIYFGEASMDNISSLKFSDYLAVGALKHNYPRNYPDNNCWSQYGFPRTQSYVYPNAGFLIGKMDDIRIYNRNLSSSEIGALVTIPSSQFVLGVSKEGTGSGNVSGNGISCGKHCAEVYNSGTKVTLTPTPAVDSVFAGWGGACSGIGSCTVTMNATKYVTATFTRANQVVASFEAESAKLTAPFVSTGGAVFQNSLTTNPLTGGKLEYKFTAPEAGEYIISAKVNAPSQASNSLFINIDAEPTSPYMVWSMSTTGGFEERIASWQGNGTVDVSEFSPKIFNLTAGQHTLVIRGREGGLYIDSITVQKKGALTLPVPTVPTPTIDTIPPVVKITAPNENASVKDTITVMATATDSAGVDGVEFRVDGVLIYDDVSAPYESSLDTTLLDNGKRTITAVARDDAGNTANDTVRITVANAVVEAPADTSAPSTPTVLEVTSANHRRVTFSWKESTDNVAVSGYDVYRDGKKIDSTITSSYTDNKVDASTSYIYTVRAYDAKGNVSGVSASLSVRTSDKPDPGPITFSPGATVRPLITTDLSFGSRTADVKILQNILIKAGYLREGLNTGYFGLATQAALRKYQCAKSITCRGGEYGRVGIATRLKLNLEAETLPSVSFTFTRSLRLGMRGEDVRELQRFLNTHGFTVTTVGGGSPGNETIFYGPATARAVSRFQEAHRSDILTPVNLTRGTGYFGPSTMRKVNELMGTITPAYTTETQTLIEKLLRLLGR